MCQEGAVYSRVFVRTNKIIIILVFFIRPTVLVIESKIPPTVPWTRESHSSPIRSFIPGLIPFFPANPSHCSVPFLLQDSLQGFPGLFIDTSKHIRFLLYSFFSVFHFL